MNKKLFCIAVLFFFVLQMYGQTVAEKLEKATTLFLSDPQLKHAVVSLYVSDTEGNKIFSLNEEYGLAPASTQKIFTSAAALSLLGESFRYKTEIVYNGAIENGELKGDLFIKGYGDPTLGSVRYRHTKPDSVLDFILSALRDSG